jgi:hypothetical protein
MAWPAISSGPVIIPRRELSLMVTVSSGPGMMAPESATMKDVTNKVINRVIRLFPNSISLAAEALVAV